MSIAKLVDEKSLSSSIFCLTVHLSLSLSPSLSLPSFLPCPFPPTLCPSQLLTACQLFLFLVSFSVGSTSYQFFEVFSELCSPSQRRLTKSCNRCCSCWLISPACHFFRLLFPISSFPSQYCLHLFSTAWTWNKARKCFLLWHSEESQVE